MPASFEWEIEEHSGPPRRLHSGASPSRRRRRWLRLGVILLVLLGLVGLLIRAWVVGRLRDADRIESELGAAVALELRTIADGDAEIFRARQDPTDRYWQARQVARYLAPGAEQFTSAPALKPSERPWEIKQLHISGRSGTVELVHWLEPLSDELFARNPETAADAFPVRSVWFYRLDDDGTWYHTAPPEDYTGLPFWWNGSRLRVRASRIEADKLDSIAQELTRLVTGSCRVLNCPRRDRFMLSLEDTLAPQVQSDRWTIPALYLTGMPENEAAQAALGQALKLWAIEALAQSRVENERLTQRVIYRQLVMRLQSEWDLLHPISPDVEMLRSALQDQQLHSLNDLWQADYAALAPGEARLIEAEVVALLDFMADQVGDGRLYEFLPGLNAHAQIDGALSEVFRLDSAYIESVWSGYLSELTGVANPLSQAAGQAADPTDQ